MGSQVINQRLDSHIFWNYVNRLIKYKNKHLLSVYSSLNRRRSYLRCYCQSTLRNQIFYFIGCFFLFILSVKVNILISRQHNVNIGAFSTICS